MWPFCGLKLTSPVFHYGEWKFQAKEWQKILTFLSTVSLSPLPHKQWICIVNDAFIGSVLYVCYVMYYIMVSRPGSLWEMCLVNWIFVWMVKWASSVDPSNVSDVWWLTGRVIIFDEFCPFDPFYVVCGWCRTISHKGCMCTSVM